MLPHDFFESLPKCELHCHLDGSLRKSTLIELSDRKGIDPQMEYFGQKHLSLEKYLERFDIICSVLQSKEAIEKKAKRKYSEALSILKKLEE